MALPVLDGNQTATTLSSVVTGGEHIVAHSVVSLGANAIANITSAVSGVAISGTVTIGNLPDATIPKDWETIGDEIGIGLNAAGLSVDVASIPAISGTVTANVTNASLFNALENYSQNWNESFPVAIKDVPNGIALPTDLVDSSGNSRFANGSLPISGTVTVGNVAGFNIPTHDFKSFGYTGSNLTQIAYKTGGASGTTVGILTLAYDGNGNLTSMTKS